MTGYIFSLITTNGMGAYNVHEDILNLIEGITIRSKKQMSILIFLSLSVFYNMFMLY